MLQPNAAAAQASPRPNVPASLIQFYSIELMPLFDGRLSVGVMATLCENDGELESMDMGSHRVASLDEALAVIRDAVAIP